LSRLLTADLAPAIGGCAPGGQGTEPGQVNDAGDRVAAADVLQCGKVGDVGLFGEYQPPRLVGQTVRQNRLSALNQDASLAKVQQRPDGVRADEPQAASDQDHATAHPRSIVC
jgi:hypothetical protein